MLAMRNTEHVIHRRLRLDVAHAGEAGVRHPVAHHDRPGGAGHVLAGGELAHDAVHRGEEGAELGLARGVGQAGLLRSQCGRQRGEEEGAES